MIDFQKMFSLMERIDPQYRQYKQILNECLLTEADSRLKAVDRIIEQAFSQRLNLNGTVSGSEYYVDNNPNTTWKQYLLFHLRHEFGLMQNSDVKYLPTVARLAYSDEVRFDMTNDNSIQIRTLNRIVEQMKKDDAFFQEVKANPNITFGQLAERFKEQFAQEDAADAESANSVSGGNSDYEIVEVTDFETAKYYGDYSYSKSRLCYTQNESTWNQYLGRYNRAYVCLRNGWKNIPEEPTEGFPYDLYGMSMIFVFVTPQREISTSNTRWNHYGEENLVKKRADEAFTKTMLAQVIGMPFDSVFKPKDMSISTDELISMIENGNCDELRGIAVGDFSIPEGTRSIGRYAFYYCPKLTSINIPNSVTSIGDFAFYRCSELTSINIPNSVTSIGQGVFHGCSGLTSITIPDGVTSIGMGAFLCCNSLTSITIPNSVTSIGQNAFSSCSNLTSITIPNSVTYIGRGAFYDCTNLTGITIPNNITNIGGYAFYYCESLTSITIPNSITTIGESTFEHCGSLTSITIPNNVTIIGSSAFESCSSLTSVTVKATTPPSLGKYVFYKNAVGRKIYVPAESVAAYKRSRGWSEYADDIEAMSWT